MGSHVLFDKNRLSMAASALYVSAMGNGLLVFQEMDAGGDDRSRTSAVAQGIEEKERQERIGKSGYHR